MKAILYLSLFMYAVSCKSVKIDTSGFYFPEPCSLVNKDDITTFFQELKSEEIQISISLDMNENTKLCAYNWVDDYKNNFLLDIYLTGLEDLQKSHTKGKISYFSIGQHNPETIELGDAAVFIPKMHDNDFQRLAIIKGNFALDMQTKNLNKETIFKIAEIALSNIPD
jgi:hypothetical protein